MRIRPVAFGVVLVGVLCDQLRAQNPSPEPTPTPSGRKVHVVTTDPADSSPVGVDPVVPTASKKDGASGEAPKTELIIAPILLSNPTIGTGGGGGAGLVFPLDRTDQISPPTTVGLGGFYTDSGSFALAFGGKTYLDEDRWRLKAIFALGEFHYDFFGVGSISDRSVPIVQEASGYTLEGLRRAWGGVFAGIRFVSAETKITLDREPQETDIDIPEQDRSIAMVTLGLHVQTDGRDSTFNPTSGSLFDFNADFADPSLGGEHTFQSYTAAYNAYRSIGTRQILAVRAAGCSVRGDAPFYNLCLYGTHSDLRGYEIGQFIDRVLLATQAEYRLSLPGRFGFVAFAGVGEVARSFGDLNSDDLLPSAGIGVRFLVAKENRINFRVDYAWGKDGSDGLYIGVGEAF
jgi:outer membrane protein assembly factor BamA